MPASAGDLVANDDGGQGLGPAEIRDRLGRRRQRRDHSHADLALGRAIAVTTVEVVGLGGGREGGASHAYASAIE
jgi:hypothetical protein